MRRGAFGLVLAAALAGCIGLQDFGAREASEGPPGAQTGDASDGASEGESDARASGDGSADAGADGSGGPEGTVLVTGGDVSVLWPTPGGTSTLRLTRDYYVDVHEVTVAQFRAWVDAGRPAPCPGATCSLDPGGSYADTMRWYPADDARVLADGYRNVSYCVTSSSTRLTYTLKDDTLPINCVTFAQAAAVCHFRGMRLLTEVEWYWAAAGRGQARTYPWGETAPATCNDAIFGLDGYGMNKCNFPKPVLSAPGDVSRDGIRDLAGSLSEWVWGGPIGVSSGPVPNDYVGEPRTASTNVTARGGWWKSAPPELETRYAWSRDPALSTDWIGFRCAKSK